MKIVSRANVGEKAWNLYCDEHPSAWWWWRTEWLDYLTAYADGNVDHSFGLTLDGCLVGICPLVQQGHEALAGGDPMPFPLVTEGYGREVLIAGSIYAQEICTMYGISRLAFRRSALSVSGCEMPIPDGYEDISWDSRIIDLTRSLDELWRGVSKGHAAVIHKGLRTINIELLDSLTSFQALHEELAQRKTRTQRTWDLMQRWADWSVMLNDDDASGVWAWGAGSEKLELAGGACFICYKQKAYYASAAYAEDDVAHAIVWTAMRQLKWMGITALELGDVNGYAGEFKKGFGGENRRTLAWRATL